jgi:hypothetical protein
MFILVPLDYGGTGPSGPTSPRREASLFKLGRASRSRPFSLGPRLLSMGKCDFLSHKDGVVGAVEALQASPDGRLN